jgi:nucleotide-binding universal stress UspA family protein
MSVHTPPAHTSYDIAVRDFTEARKRAAFRQLINRLTGDDDELLSYNEVRRHMLTDVDELIEKGVREIPLDAIVGSVGRYKDYTRDFLPKRDSDKERWARVRASVIDMKGWSPIEVYQLGEIYFVKDGNHRVSVARQMDVSTISASVTEIKSNIDLKPGDNPIKIIAQANYETFLQRTRLDELRPGADLSITLTGGYRCLLAEIETHASIVEAEQGEPLSAESKVTLWYDDVYMPVINLIREQGLTHTFRRRTETDIYIILAENHDDIEEELGWTIDPQHVALDMVDEQRESTQSPVKRLSKRLRDAVVQVDLEDGPAAGVWRQQAHKRRKRLFRSILVAFEGIPQDSVTLDQALIIAKHERARINAIYLHDSKNSQAGDASEKVTALFESRINASKLKGNLALMMTPENERSPIIDLSRWNDLAVVSLTHPPGPNMGGRRGNPFIRLIQQSPRPILAVPGAGSPLSHALVGYDGSPKADEALFLACYVAQKWGVQLTVLTVETNHTSQEALDAAKNYLDECDVTADYILRDQGIADALLDVSAETECDWLIMGGFGFRPMKHLMLGSTVDRMLREFQYPMLICR